MQDINELKITEAEKARLLIKNANNRPNAMATYGQAKKSSSDVKDMFDQQFEFIAGRFNKFCEAKSEEQSEIILAEQSRASAELVREKAEVVRAEAEIARVTAEKGRAAAEVLRVKADGERDVFLGDLGEAVGEILEIQDKILNGDAELVAREEVIKAINETLLIADDLETDDPYKALSAAQGVVLKSLVDSATKTVCGWYNGTDSKILELVFPFAPKFVFIAGIGYYDVDEDTRARDSRFGVIIPQEGIMLCQSGSVPNIHQTLEGSPNISLDGNTLILDAGNLVTTDRGVIFNIFLSEWPTYKPATRESAYGYRYFAIG